MFKIDSAGATGDNQFTEGDSALGTPATVVSADWLNAVQAELIAILAAAGIAPAKANNAQVYAALQVLFAAKATENTVNTHVAAAAPHSGHAAKAGNAAQQFSAAAGTLGYHVAILSQFAEVHATNGSFKLPGGLTVMWGVVAVASLDVYDFSFHTPFATDCFFAIGGQADGADRVMSVLGSSRRDRYGLAGNAYGTGAANLLYIAVGH